MTHVFRAAGLFLRQRYRSLSLRFKIAFFIVILLTSTSFCLSAITVRIMNNYILTEIIKRGASVGKSIAASAGYNLLSKDLLGLDNLVYQAKSANSDMRYVAIVDPDRKTVVHSSVEVIGATRHATPGRPLRSPPEGTTVRELHHAAGNIFEIECPIKFMKKPLGSVVVGIDASILLEAQRKVVHGILFIFGAMVLIGVVASWLLATFLMRPIRELSAGVEELKFGVSQTPLRVYSQDELGDLTRNFNEMSALIGAQQGTLTRYAGDLEEAYVSMVKVVAAAIDARDAYTHGHSARVAQLSLRLGERIGLSEADLRDLEVACLLHDVGKIKTPDAILLKADQLDPGEYREMMQHVEHGAAILGWAPSLAKYIPSTRHHHEWHNGKGYPDRLAGNEIPLFAAVIGIVDAYDAMTTDRPYRKARLKEEALLRIVRMSGSQFRPDLVKVFLELMTEDLPHKISPSIARASG